MWRMNEPTSFDVIAKIELRKRLTIKALLLDKIMIKEIFNYTIVTPFIMLLLFNLTTH